MYGVRPIYLIVVLIALAGAYFSGLQIDIMDVDAAQYASISMEMADSGEYLQVKHRGQDYLDKPPLLFWTSAIMFKMFGLHNWSYKLVSLLFSLLGIYSTYRFARLYYGERVAKLSALLLATCQALFLINNDVRTDTMLLGAIIFGVWQIAEVMRGGGLKYAIGAGIGIGLAMLTKGPIGLMVPILAFGTDIVAKRQFGKLFKWQWLVVLVVAGALLAPMVYGLYQQYGSYGPYFYFWAQSFGRLTGDNPFINSGLGKQPFSPLFFTHTFLWSFLPWSLFAVFGIFGGIYAITKKSFHIDDTEEAISLGGFVLPFIAMSLSEYKLPHYIYVSFPFAAVFAARYIDDLVSGRTWHFTARFFVGFHRFVATVIVLIAIVLGVYFFPVGQIWLWVVFGTLGVFMVVSLFSKDTAVQIVTPLLVAIVAANLLINTGIYPLMNRYQSTSYAGRYFAEHTTPTDEVLLYGVHAHAIEFYAKRLLNYRPLDSEIGNLLTPGLLIYTTEDGKRKLDELGMEYTTLETFEHYNVTLMHIGFLNPATRPQYLDERYILRIE